MLQFCPPARQDSLSPHVLHPPEPALPGWTALAHVAPGAAERGQAWEPGILRQTSPQRPSTLATAAELLLWRDSKSSERAVETKLIQ